MAIMQVDTDPGSSPTAEILERLYSKLPDQWHLATIYAEVETASGEAAEVPESIVWTKV